MDDARAERLARILHLLRERGGRVTPARRAVVAALVEADEHVTADDLAGSVQRQLPDVHLSTVYRTLERLEELGVLDHAHLGHGRAVYHLSDERHHHLVCDECGSVTEVPPHVFDDLVRGVRDAYGFSLEPTHFALGGRCARCAA